MAIRSFVALSIPGEMANVLGDCSAQMAYQDKSNSVRWVDQPNYHLTLAFLDQQSEQSLALLAERIDQQVHLAPIDLSISHLSPFPERRPKLIAAIIKQTAELETLHKQISNNVNASGMRIEKRRFLPHITLGRFRHSRNLYAGTIPTNLQIQADSLELAIYESILTVHGAEYQALYSFPLSDYYFDEI